MPTSNPQSLLVPPGVGKAYWVAGDHVTFKIGSAQSNGKFVLAETITAPGLGPPPHLHHREDEMFYIAEGEFGFVFGDTSLTAAAGDMVYLPRDIVHGFRNISTTPGRLLVVATGGGFEQFVPEAGCPASASSDAPPPVDDAAVGKLLAACAKFALEMKFDHKPGAPAPLSAAAKEYWLLGLHIRTILGSEQTRGNFSVAEVTCTPGTGVPAHLHHVMDEFFYVIRGTFEFEIDGQKMTASPGAVVYVPAGAVHGLRNIGTSPAMLIDYHTPGGFEAFFAEAGVPCSDRSKPPVMGPPDVPALAAIMSRHGMTLV